MDEIYGGVGIYFGEVVPILQSIAWVNMQTMVTLANILGTK